MISLLSYAVSLCTHEQSWLVIGYLILFDLFVLAPGGRLRAALVRMWREAWIWLGFLFLTFFAMVNYFEFYYAPLKPRATITELIRYVGVQFTQGFAPTAMGLRPMTSGWMNTVALVIDTLVFLAIVLVSIYRRPSAWRVWTVFAVGFLANSIMIGANRVGYYGVGFGKELYYLQSPAYLFLLCVGAAFSLDASGVPYVTQQSLAQRPRAPGHLRVPTQRVRTWVVLSCLVAFGLYAVAFVTSATTLTVKDQSSVESAASRAYFTRLLGQMDAAVTHGQQAAVLNAAVPDGVLDSGFAPWNQLSYDLPVVSPGAVVDQLRTKTFEVAPDGTLSPMRFVRNSGTSQGLPISVIIGTSGATPTEDRLFGAAATCFTAARPGSTISIRLASSVSTPNAWLLVGVGSSEPSSIEVSTASGGVPSPVGTITLPAAMRMTSDYVLPLSARTLDQVQLSVATPTADVCVSSVDVGNFQPSATSR